jgi:hypothetical protein
MPDTKVMLQFLTLNKKMIERGFHIEKVSSNGIEWYKPIGLAILRVWLYRTGENDYIGYDSANGNFSASSFEEAATRLFQRLECITG